MKAFTHRNNLLTGLVKTVGKRFASNSFEEVRIPNGSGGYISGKWWGSRDKRPILALHGWQDNCGTFDLLIPQLPQHLSFLAVDAPGHGLSSKIPRGMFYYGHNGVLMVRHIKEYFGWNKISLLGHSMGGITSYTYGFLFPSTVDFMVCIDGLHPLIHPNPIERTAKSFEEFSKYDAQNSSMGEPPSYTLDEMCMRLHLGTRKSIDLNKCMYIIERNVATSNNHPGKFYFKRDARLKCGPVVSWSTEDIIESAKRVTFPLFASKADESPFFQNEDVFKKASVELRAHSKDFEFHNVPGKHHGHLNHPEIFKDILSRFIEKHDKEDRSEGGFKEEMRVNY